MQRGRGGRDYFFGGTGSSLFSAFFGGRGDPFDDPFFTQPFGGGISMLGPTMFTSRRRSFSGEPKNTNGFLEPQPAKGKAPIITELFSDDDDEEEGGGGDKPINDNPREHSRDQEVEEKKSKATQSTSAQERAYTFHSSTATCGGVDGTYYTSSTTRRTGGNGVVAEESKEADTTIGRATHKVSRGIHDKGMVPAFGKTNKQLEDGHFLQQNGCMHRGVRGHNRGPSLSE